MSASSRSIAAARQRRAGDPPSIGQMQPGQIQPGQMQPGQMQPGQIQRQMQTGQIQRQMQPGQMQPGQMQPGQNNFSPQQPNKNLPEIPQKIGNGPGEMKISDVIALVTIRLSNIEKYVLKLQAEGVGEKPFSSVDPSIIQAIVSRLETLEAKSTLVQQPQPQPQPQPQTQEMEEKIEFLFTELESLKDMLLKTQSFAMETNQKLVDMVLPHEPGPGDGLGKGFSFPSPPFPSPPFPSFFQTEIPLVFAKEQTELLEEPLQIEVINE